MIRIRLCIPTHNNPLTLEQVVVDCLRETDLPVLVVCEGSDLPELSIRDGRLEILGVPKNSGKASAIQAAIADSARRGFTHLLTMDADGAHLVQEVKILVAVSNENPQDLILTNRPGSGLRIYPLAHVRHMRFWSKGSDFDIEALVRLLWKNVAVREVDTAVSSTKPDMPLSRRQKFVLATLSVLKTHRTPTEVGTAVGAGVFLGCTPFFGFHTFLAVALSFLFRLNVVYVWLGTQVSNPFLAGFLTVASIGVGRYVIKTSSHTVAGFSLEWLVGSMCVGGVLGIVSGVTSYLVTKELRRNSSA